MPELAGIEYVLKTRATDARPAVAALEDLIQEMASKATSCRLRR